MRESLASPRRALHSARGELSTPEYQPATVSKLKRSEEIAS